MVKIKFLQKNLQRKNDMVLQDLIPRVKNVPLFANVERIFQSTTDFIRGNLLVSTASIGAGVTGLVAAAAVVRARKKRKKKAVARRRKVRKRKRKPTRKRKKVRKKRKKRRVIRGRGLGTHEIKHSGKSTKGKFKFVSFKDKRTGKMVRFKARR